MHFPSLEIIFLTGQEPYQYRVPPAFDGRWEGMTAEDGQDRVLGAVAVKKIHLVDLRLCVELLETQLDLLSFRYGDLPFTIITACVIELSAAIFQGSFAATYIGNGISRSKTTDCMKDICGRNSFSA